MNTLAFSATIGGAAFAAGFLGSLTGLGGGVVVVPLLTIVFGADIHYAIGASLVSVIATSSGAAAAYVKEGFTNLRIGMLLEVATTFGALVGAWLVGIVPANAIAVIFGLVLIQSAYLASKPRSDHATENLAPDPLASRLKLDSTFPTERGEVRYHVFRVPGGFALMWIAGVLSGLLGIGSGAVKVLAIFCLILVPLLFFSLDAGAFKQEDLDKLSATKQCPFCDLASAELPGAGLSGSRLPGSRLSEANLSNADLSEANLRNANISHGRLVNANLSKADLSGADLSKADLSGASLSHAKLSGTELSGATLSGADLSGANLSGAYWVDGKKCKEGSIGECKKDSGGSEKRTGGGRGSRGGSRGFPLGQ